MASSPVFGRYEIRSLLGKGGMASVYLAYDPRFDRQVALKVLPREFLHDPAFFERFHREARTIARLEHYAIVPVYDFGEHLGQPYLVMRYMPGGTLESRLVGGPLPLLTIAPILKRLADALDYSHNEGVVHRDLKPGNILFDNQENAFLSDFGIAKLAETTVTLTGDTFLGTPAYASPEQVQGGQVLDGRSDIYTLGVILFQMLTGEMPFKADTPVQQLMAHVLNPVPNILEFRHDLPPQCETVIAQAMAKSRDDRYRTAARMAAIVEEVARLETSPRPRPRTAVPATPTDVLPAPVTAVPDPTVREEVRKPSPAPSLPTKPPIREQPLPSAHVAPVYPVAKATPETAVRQRPPVWAWAGLALLGVALVAGLWALWNRQDGKTASPPQAETTKPLGQIIEEAWAAGYDVTDLTHQPGNWGVVLSDGAGYGRQTWHVTSESPLPKIEAMWAEGFAVSSVAYGDGNWVVVFSSDAGLGRQSWRQLSESPIAYIQEQWQNGYEVTSLAYGDGTWAVVMSGGNHLGQQLCRFSSESPLGFIEEHWALGYEVTSLAYGDGAWAVVMSENSNLGQQLWQRTSESPKSYMQAKWEEGYDVTSIAYGEDSWAIIMSQEANLGRQWWLNTARFVSD